MAATTSSFSPSIPSLSSTTTVEPPHSTLFTPHSNFFTPNYASKKTNVLTFRLHRLRISHRTAISPKSHFRVLACSGLGDGDSGEYPESGPSSLSSSSSNDATTIDLKLPRRSLIIQFTCDECGERTQRLINRVAYERGTVFVQCAGCLRHHKLVDNLGLVVEYDFREDTSAETNKDKV